jgi:YVTN family beta-propeller protein
MTSSPFATGGAPTSVVVDPTGNYVYVTNSTDNTISIYAISSGTTLNPVGTIPTGGQPSSVVATQ